MTSSIRLRALLVLLAFIAVAPGMAALFYSSVVMERDELARSQQELESVATLVAVNQEELIEGVRQILAAVASGPSIKRTDLHSLCVDFLRNIRAATPNYANIGMINLQGDIDCQAQGSEMPTNASDRAYFRKAIQSRAFSVGGYMVGRSSGRKSLGFGMPVLDYASALRGVVFASLDLEYANQQLKSIQLPGTLRIVVTDAEGRILVSSDNARDPVGALSADMNLRTSAATKVQGARTVVDRQGVKWLHARRAISGAGSDGLTASVSLREDDAVAAARAHFRSQLGLMAAASLLGFLLAWLFANRSLAAPVARLLERMRRVERELEDDTQDKPAPHGNAELAELDAGFTSMLSRLRTRQQQLTRAQEITRVGFYEMDLGTRRLSASPNIYESFGLPADTESISYEHYQSLLHPHDRIRLNEERARLFNENKPLRLQYRVIRPDGSMRWLDGFGFVDRDEHGKPIRYSGAVQDITEQRLAQQEALIHENRFRLLFENSLDGVLQATFDGAILAANTAACQILGMSEEALRQRGRAGIIDPADPRLAPLLAERAATGRARGELTLIRGDGSRFEAEVNTSMYTDADGNVLSSVVLRDITDRILAQQHIQRLAFFDALTELPNRRLLLDRLATMYAAAERNGQVGGVLFVDLDHFKHINDARGHATGDALLRQVAQRMAALMRAEDTVARIGGDEFVMLLPGIAIELTCAAANAMVVAEKVRHALMQPFHIDGQPYGCSASIGVTLLPGGASTPDDLLREADTAMYRAKTAGRNRIAFFEAAMQSEVEERLALKNDLAQAIGTPQLEMHLQPQFDHAGQTAGCELLMRWTHPRRGVVPPGVFIPVAEETGLIFQLGDWALQQACLMFLRLERAGRALPVSVNVSPRQFHQADFVQRVKAILEETGAPASQLILEVTEGLLIDDLDETVRRMNELVEIGIRFSIDDFGTGYSSLAYLRRLPLYELKIDRSFVRDTPHDPGDTAIVQSILSMARHLGLRVVAEGVETDAQAQFLRQEGCGYLQGYLFARPMPVDEWLRQ